MRGQPPNMPVMPAAEFYKLSIHKLFAVLNGLFSIAIPLLYFLYTLVRVANLCFVAGYKKNCNILKLCGAVF